MEAVPILCNLLLYEDRQVLMNGLQILYVCICNGFEFLCIVYWSANVLPQLVENVATCLIKIVDRVSHSSEMLDELCKHGLIQQVTHLLSVNGRATLSQLIYNVSNFYMLFSYPTVLHFLLYMNFDVIRLWIYYFAGQGLIGLLVKLSSGSVVAFRTLYELNIGSILREILSAFDLSHGVSTSQLVGGHCNRVCAFDLSHGVVIWLCDEFSNWQFFILIVLIMQDYN
jgi:E3 ubiquitin-protein ligase TRIP12